MFEFIIAAESASNLPLERRSVRAGGRPACALTRNNGRSISTDALTAPDVHVRARALWSEIENVAFFKEKLIG